MRFLKFMYLKLFRINDTPERVALGLGVGVFLGILPGTGPLAALFMAFIFRLNRASALLGSVLTNTWFSIVTFILAVKLGAWALGLNWRLVSNAWLFLIRDFHFSHLFNAAALKIILPVVLGYIIVAFFSALVVYLTALIVLKQRKRK